MKNWFVELSAIDVNGKTEEKNGLTYLSWMWAWAELKKRYPLSYATVHETPEGMLVWRDPIGCHVKTSVTLVWEESDGLHEHTVTEYLPVMDFKNKSVPYENVDSMTVNKTIQRSLTKCIARLGIGGYIYAGEDLPEEASERKAEEAEAAKKAEADIKTARAAVVTACKKAINDGIPKETVYQVISERNNGNPNPNGIKDVETLNTILKLVKQLTKVKE